MTISEDTRSEISGSFGGVMCVEDAHFPCRLPDLDIALDFRVWRSYGSLTISSVVGQRV